MLLLRRASSLGGETKVERDLVIIGLLFITIIDLVQGTETGGDESLR